MNIKNQFNDSPHFIAHIHLINDISLIIIQFFFKSSTLFVKRKSRIDLIQLLTLMQEFDKKKITHQQLFKINTRHTIVFLLLFFIIIFKYIYMIKNSFNSVQKFCNLYAEKYIEEKKYFINYVPKS